MLVGPGLDRPGVLDTFAGKAKPEDFKLVQELTGLLQSVAVVVPKFDFFGHSLSVTREGLSPGTYLRESVTEVRVPREHHHISQP